ncbi:MAG: NADH-quinone oxidoreductase subunit M [Candidatus Omnitrophica bacterium]|nr:NADH-quinone oxidoreductase subunit M [Candidatus Omnitrophota bacterium]
MIIAIPLCASLLGAIAILLTPADQPGRVRRIAVAAAGAALAAAVGLGLTYDAARGGYQHELVIPWIPTLGVSCHLGVDGISVVLTLLHAICAFAGVLVSYSITERVKEYFLFYLLLIAGVFGVFTSLDLFFFYLFYEMAVIPMFPLIGIWGSHDIKDYATMKLTLYLTAGAVLALLGLLGLYFAVDLRTFDLVALEQWLAQRPLPGDLQRWLFPFLLVGFGVIAPMWPLHSWSPIGHAAAPAPVSMLHAGVLMKLGSYAIIRIGLGLLPQGAYAWMPWVASLCMMNILYGGFVALAQRDSKFMVGYSSSSHMGYVLLGIACLNAVALNGAVLLMFAHGVMTALAFALIGHIYDQTHTRLLGDWGGLAKAMPFVATCFTIAAMASAGVPGFGNFVAELLVVIGAWDTYRWQGVGAVFGVVITAVYMLRAVRTGFFGPLPARWASLRDATTPFQRLPYLVLIAVLVIVGCWPGPLLAVIDSSTHSLIDRVNAIRTVARLDHPPSPSLPLPSGERGGMRGSAEAAG